MPADGAPKLTKWAIPDPIKSGNASSQSPASHRIAWHLKKAVSVVDVDSEVAEPVAVQLDIKALPTDA
jgi:hypothetical protein